MICELCDYPIEGEYATCSSCGTKMHKDCANQCMECSKPLCDVCSLNNKFKCKECNSNFEPIHSMDFISSTMFESYLKCPYAFYHEFIVDDRYKTKMQDDSDGNKYSKTGQLLHDLFDRWSQKEVEEHNFDTMYEEYCQMFNTIPHEMFDNEQDAMDFLARGYTTIKNWIEEEKEKPRPLYTEKQHFVTLDEALPKIRVTIDRINGEPNDVSNWEVEDYKTGKVYSSTMLSNNMQLPIYALAIQKEYGALPRMLRLRFPQHTNRKGIVQTREFERITDDIYVCDVARGGTYSISLSQRLEQMKGIYQSIQKGDFPCNTKNSHFCNNFCKLGMNGECHGIETRWHQLG